MHYLAIDPGKTPGAAWATAEGNMEDMTKFSSEDQMLDWLELQEPTVLIVEIYRNRPGDINAWSKGETQQQVGAIKRIARKKKWQIHEQEPSPCLAMGLRYLGVYQQYYKRKGGKTVRVQHVPDHISALAHLTYYLRKNTK